MTKAAVDPFTAVSDGLWDFLFSDASLAQEIEKFNRLTSADERRRRGRRTLATSNPSVRIAHVFAQHQPFKSSTTHESILRFDVRLRVGKLDNESTQARLQWLIFRRMCQLRGDMRLGLPYVHKVMLESHEQSAELVEQQDGWLSVIIVQVHCHFSNDAIDTLEGIVTP